MKRPLLITLAGAVLGSVVAWLYWRFVGCSTGGCAITSHPLNSALYGALMGALLASAIAPKVAKDPKPKNP